MSVDVERIVRSVDHTLLKVDASWPQIQALCDDAIRYGTASVCIPPAYAEKAVDYMDGRIPVCVVIGFPNGYSTTASKIFEAQDAIRCGVSEVDMVINVGWVKSGFYDKVLDEIREIKKAVGDKVLKVIIETCLLTEDEKAKMCEIVTQSGADYIKTSTGFSTGGATLDDVKLMRRLCGANVKVKAAGGIHTLEEAQAFLDAGADRLGTSSVIAALKAVN